MIEDEHLSASGIKSFVRCPRQFWYKYISEIEPPDDGMPDFFAVGNTIHESIEAVLNEYPENIDDGAFLKSAFLGKSDNLDYDYSDDDKVDNCFATASRWISSFVSEVKCVEEHWEMERDGITYFGMADLVADVEQNGELYENAIVDWKSGQVIDEDEEWKERVQGGMYAEMFYEEYGEYPDAIIFVYLDEEQQSLHARIRDGKVYWNEHKNDYWEEIAKYKNKILLSESKDDWKAKPEQSKCYFCDFKHHCKYSGVGAEEVQSKHITFNGMI